MDLSSLSGEALSQLLASDRTPSELFSALSEYECQACLHEDSMDPDLLSLFYASYFFSHLLIDQICEARMLTKRMPQKLLEQAPSLQNCLALLRAVWQRKHDDVYKILRELPWPERLEPLVQRYDRHFQQKTLVEVSKAYEAIRPASAATYLGIDSASSEQGNPATIQRLRACGWTWNEQENLLQPKSIVTESDTTVDISNKLNEAMALIRNSGR